MSLSAFAGIQVSLLPPSSTEVKVTIYRQTVTSGNELRHTRQFCVISSNEDNGMSNEHDLEEHFIVKSLTSKMSVHNHQGGDF